MVLGFTFTTWLSSWQRKGTLEGLFWKITNKPKFYNVKMVLVLLSVQS